MHFLGLYWGIDGLLFAFFQQSWHLLPVRKDDSAGNCCSDTLPVLCLSAAAEERGDESEAAGTRPSYKQGPRRSLRLRYGQQPDGNGNDSGVKTESFRGVYQHRLQCGAGWRSNWTRWNGFRETEYAWTGTGSYWTLRVPRRSLALPSSTSWSQSTFQGSLHAFGAFSKPKCLQLSPNTWLPERFDSSLSNRPEVLAVQQEQRLLL